MNEHIERKDQARALWKDWSLHDLVAQMAEVRAIKDAQDEVLKDINANYDVLRLELIPAKMEEEGIQKITFEDIGRVSLTADMYVRMGDKQSYFVWLRENGLEDLIQPTINSSTLKAWAKGRVQRGEEIPDSLSVTPFIRASITKA